MKDSVFYKKAPMDAGFFRKSIKDVVPIFRKAPKITRGQMQFVRPMVK